MINVAFCSETRTVIDSHFARCAALIIYAVDETSYQQVGEIAFFDQEEGEDDKVGSRIKVLENCSIVYCTAIGGPAAARLVQHKIHPLKVPDGAKIQVEIEKLQKMLRTNPPPWLKKRNLV